MTICLFVFAGIILYTYFVYPLLLFCVVSFRDKRIATQRNVHLPGLTFIVAVYNAEDIVEKKILNTFRCSYPKDKIDYIFVSDGCTDATNNIIKKYPCIRLIDLSARVGKEQALQYAIAFANNEVLCFSDAGTMVDGNTLEILARNFSDPGIGAVSSYDRSPGLETTLESIHIWYEMLLRELESEVSSCVGVSGSLFLARKNLCELLTADCCSDLAITFVCEKHNYRSVLEKSAYGTYNKSVSVQQEWVRKKRTIVHGINTVVKHRDVLHLSKYGFFSWQVFSHKILRWLSPISFICFFVLSGVWFFGEFNIYRLGSDNYGVVLVSALMLIIAAVVFRKFLLTNISLFFVYHIALLAALADVLRKKKVTVWEPTKRQ